MLVGVSESPVLFCCAWGSRSSGSSLPPELTVVGKDPLTGLTSCGSDSGHEVKRVGLDEELKASEPFLIISKGYNFLLTSTTFTVFREEPNLCGVAVFPPKIS